MGRPADSRVARPAESGPSGPGQSDGGGLGPPFFFSVLSPPKRTRRLSRRPRPTANPSLSATHRAPPGRRPSRRVRPPHSAAKEKGAAKPRAVGRVRRPEGLRPAGRDFAESVGQLRWQQPAPSYKSAKTNALITPRLEPRHNNRVSVTPSKFRANCPVRCRQICRRQEGSIFGNAHGRR